MNICTKRGAVINPFFTIYFNRVIVYFYSVITVIHIAAKSDIGKNTLIVQLPRAGVLITFRGTSLKVPVLPAIYGSITALLFGFNGQAVPEVTF